ncbi:MAG: hypothetical protein EA344_04125 [Alkalicoccus sp.]|nr:MAG: hypothetical protein EA344_04125 [Alkalicoccus sp.]
MSGLHFAESSIHAPGCIKSSHSKKTNTHEHIQYIENKSMVVIFFVKICDKMINVLQVESKT